VVIQNLESEGPLDTECLRIVHGFLDGGISKAAARYAEIEIEHREFRAKKFEDARVEAEKASEAKSAFLANMSHEIRTPLGAIMGFVELLKDSGISHEEIAKYHVIIERNSRHLLRILDDILDLTKVEAGKMVIEKIEFSLAEFIADFISLAGLRARDNGINLEFKAETPLPELIVSDPTRLRQVLSNVIGNAIKFTEKSHVDLEMRYEGDLLKFKVTDTGRGISKEQRKNLFQAFSQADSSTTRKFGGTGLGLVLTKKLCQAMGGDFNLLESDLGKGSVFEASITISFTADVKLMQPQALRITLPVVKTTDPEHIDLTGLEILLVEDSPDNQFLIQQMRSKSGARISTAMDGAAGVKHAVEKSFDVILMDIQMPIMDGHEAVRTLRA
jgi:signal transduction histidine kinase